MLRWRDGSSAKKAAAKNQIAHPSEGGSEPDLAFITSLTLSTYGQQRTTRHSDPVMQALIQKHKEETHCSPAGFLSTVHYSQISKQRAGFDARSDRETALMIQGENEE